MSKIKLLLDVAGDLRSLAESIQAIADAIGENEAANNIQHESPTSATEPNEIKKAITLEEVRAVLADKSQSGKTDEVHALVKQFGAEKLSAVDPGKYSDLLKVVEGLYMTSNMSNTLA